MKIGLALLGCLASLSACSGGVSSTGQGSSTLTVNATVSAENNSVNASASSDFTTQLGVRVTKAGVPLTGAMVELDSDLGNVVLTERIGNQGQGQGANYTGQQAGYSRTYTLGVHLGADFLENVALSGPEAFNFSAPLVAAQAVSGQPLEVKWSPSGSTSATLDTQQLNTMAVPDTGSYTVPAGGLKTADPGKTTDERVRVRRSETLVPHGIVGDSSLTISVTNEVTFLVVGP